MRTLLTIALCAAMILSITACGAEAEKPELPQEPVIVTEGTDAPLENDEVPEAAELDEVEMLSEYLKEKELYKNHYQDEVKPDYFEHSIAEYWIYELTDGSRAYLRLFDSEETAKKEASNYKDGDASHYTAYDDGELVTSTIIDYAMPVWLWQHSAAIIEFGSDEPNADEIVKKLCEKLGDYFASTQPTVLAVPEENGEDAPAQQPSESDSDGAAYDISTQTFEPVDLSLILADANDDVMAVVAGDMCAYDVVQLASVDIQYLDKIVEEQPTLISSISELESYCAANKEALSTDECQKALDRYKEEYFDKSSVLLVPLMSGTVSEGFRLNEMKINRKNIVLDIAEAEGDADALDFHLMIVGLKNVKFDKLTTKIKANRINDPLAKYPLCHHPLAEGNPNTDGETKLDYKWEAIRTNGDGYPRQTVITDRAALDKYFERFSAGWFNIDEIKDKLSSYTDEWFAQNSLIIVAVEYGSGSTRVFVDGVTQSGNDIAVTLRTETPEVGTADMAGWQILIETPKLNGSETVAVAGAKGFSNPNLATE